MAPGGCVGAPGGAPGGCTGAPAACCDSGHSRAGLLDRIRARHAAKSAGCHGAVAAPDCCPAPAPAPVPVPAPAPVAAPAPCCDAAPSCCDSGRGHHMLGKVRDRGHSHKAPSCCSTAQACDSCATPGGPVVVPTTPAPGGTTTPPKEMPKPVDKKGMTDAESASIPPLPLPARPAAGGANAPGTPY